MSSIRLRSNLRRIYLVALAAHVLFVGAPAPEVFLAGAALVVLGRGLQAWTSGHLEKVNDRRGPDPAVPTASGPYGHLRNPLAWSSYISDLGFGVLSGAPILLAIHGILYWAITMRRIVRYEEPMLRRRCGWSYESYAAGVPRIWPSLRPWEGAVRRRFSMQRFWKNAQLSRLLGAFAQIGIFRLLWIWGEGRGAQASADLWPVIGLTALLGASSLFFQAIEDRPHVVRRWIWRRLIGVPDRA